MSDLHAGHENLDAAFSNEQWHGFRREDKKAGTAIVALMVAIFSIGVALYSVVAVTL